MPDKSISQRVAEIRAQYPNGEAAVLGLIDAIEDAYRSGQRMPFVEADTTVDLILVAFGDPRPREKGYDYFQRPVWLMTGYADALSFRIEAGQRWADFSVVSEVGAIDVSRKTAKRLKKVMGKTLS